MRDLELPTPAEPLPQQTLTLQAEDARLPLKQPTLDEAARLDRLHGPLAATGTDGPNIAYSKGDKGEYTGKTVEIHGGKFRELRMLEGVDEGQIKHVKDTRVTAPVPDAPAVPKARDFTPQPDETVRGYIERGMDLMYGKHGGMVETRASDVNGLIRHTYKRGMKRGDQKAAIRQWFERAAKEQDIHVAKQDAEIAAGTRLRATTPQTLKARGVLETHLGPTQKDAVRSVMDRIVGEHPKDPAAQLAAAEKWIAENPAGTSVKAVADVPWRKLEDVHGADAGAERTIDGPAGKVLERKFDAKPHDEIRAGLTADGFKYDYREKVWRKQLGDAPTSAVPAQGTPSSRSVTSSGPAKAAAPESALPAKARVRQPPGVRLPKLSKPPTAALEAAGGAKTLAATPEGKAVSRALGTNPRALGNNPRAKNLKRALESGTPEDGAAWVESVKEKGDGTDLASGFAGLQQMFKKDPATAWLLTRMAIGGTIGARNDEEDPWLGFIMGAGSFAFLSKRFVGAGAKLGAKLAGEVKATPWKAAKTAASRTLPKLRADPPSKTEDISWAQSLRRPEGVFPEHFENIQGGYHQVEDFLSGAKLPKPGRDLHGNISDDPFTAIRDLDPSDPVARNLASGVFFKDALSTLRKDLKSSTDAGHKRRARYLRSLERAVLEEPARIHELIADLPGIGASARSVGKIDNWLTNHAYRILLGAAMDTAIINRTQPLLNVKNVPLKYVAEGVRQAKTPEGKRRSEFAKVHRPQDVEVSARSGGVLGKIDEFLGAPMQSGDTMNRRETYLGSRQYGLDQGATSEAADAWAKGAMRQTQSEPGPAGKHPRLRELGPMKVFQNYPHLWAELMVDTIALRKENPEGFRRMVGYLLGGALTGAVTGINTWNLMFPRFGLSLNAHTAPIDLANHLLAGASEVSPVGPDFARPDHTLAEDFLGGGGKTGLVTPRYPRKLYDEVKHLVGYGVDKKTGEHITRDPKGRERSRHTTWEGLLGLAGVETSRLSGEKADTSKAYQFTAEQKRKSTLSRRGVQRALADAIDADDHKRVSDILAGMPARQRRDMRRAVEQTKWQRMRAQVPKRDRAEFDQQFGDRVK